MAPAPPTPAVMPTAASALVGVSPSSPTTAPATIATSTTTAAAITTPKDRETSLTVVARLVGVTAVFVAYEAWRAAVGSLVLAHWLGFVVCALALWLLPPRLQRWARHRSQRDGNSAPRSLGSAKSTRPSEVGQEGAGG